jgi:hypothetical protein
MKDACCVSGIRQRCKFAEDCFVGLKQKKIQKLFEIDLALQADSALLEASQHTKRISK